MDERQVRITEGEAVILAELGERTPDSYTVFAIGFKATNEVDDQAIIKLYEQVAELVADMPGVTIHTQGRIAAQAYESALRMVMELEAARARHQAGTS